MSKVLAVGSFTWRGRDDRYRLTPWLISPSRKDSPFDLGIKSPRVPRFADNRQRTLVP